MSWGSREFTLDFLKENSSSKSLSVSFRQASCFRACAHFREFAHNCTWLYHVRKYYPFLEQRILIICMNYVTEKIQTQQNVLRSHVISLLA